MSSGTAVGAVRGTPRGGTGNGVYARQHLTWTTALGGTGGVNQRAPRYNFGALPGFTNYVRLDGIQIGGTGRPDTLGGPALTITRTIKTATLLLRTVSSGTFSNDVYIASTWTFTHPQNLISNQPYTTVYEGSQIWNVTPGVSTGIVYYTARYSFNAGTTAGWIGLRLAHTIYGPSTGALGTGTKSTTTPDRTGLGNIPLSIGGVYHTTPHSLSPITIKSNFFSGTAATMKWWTGIRIGYTTLTGSTTITTATGLFITGTSHNVTHKWGLQVQWTSGFGQAVMFGAGSPGTSGYSNSTRPVFAVTVRGSGNHGAIGLRKTTSAPATSPPTGGYAIFAHVGTSTGHTFLCIKTSAGHYLYFRTTGTTATRQLKYSATLPT